MKALLKNTLRRLLYVKDCFFERDHLLQELKTYKTWVPPGHFYSPIPSIKEIKDSEDKIFGDLCRDLPAIDLNIEEQLSLLSKFKQYYGSLPFEAHQTGNLRYYYENDCFSYLDAIVLYGMIRDARPSQIIEVGSGYSSCLILDTNELFFDNSIRCTFIEPYADRLRSLVQDRDMKNAEFVESNLQNTNITKFSTLSAGDILFIDSTHVSKINSDVNYVFFQILPHIRSGVHVHFHDIFYPFEYPKEWIYGGVAWNEAYLLRGFLEYNKSFKITFFNSLIKRFFPDKLVQALPLAGLDPEPDVQMKNAPAGSIWITKV